MLDLLIERKAKQVEKNRNHGLNLLQFYISDVFVDDLSQLRHKCWLSGLVCIFHGIEYKTEYCNTSINSPL